MLPEIRHLYEDGRIDPFMIGQYDDCVDLIFQYQYESDLCTAPINAADKLRHWAMFEENPQRKWDDKSMEKFSQLLRDEHHKQAKKLKIGRNDPCPCGSGKKYKKCCLNKPKSSIDLIESIQDRQKWLANYPAPASERREGRVYLEDFFDAGSIEIDQIVYLALHHRAIPIWNREPDNIAESRTWEYLKEAFAKLKQKAKKEEITALDQYNEKYSIHYQCEEWLNILAELSMKHGDMALYHEVSAYCR